MRVLLISFVSLYEWWHTIGVDARATTGVSRGLNFATSAKSSSSDTNCIIGSDLAASFSASKSLAHRSVVFASRFARCALRFFLRLLLRTRFAFRLDRIGIDQQRAARVDVL